MPFVLDRRFFLRRSVAAGVALPLLRRFAFAQPKQEMHLALLSDTHIAADRGDAYRGFSPHQNLKQVLAQVQQTSFDAMLINGDLARAEGKPGDYEALTEYLEPLAQKMPLAITMGNHDDRKNARSSFASLDGEVQPVEKKFVNVIDAGALEFLLLDSLMVTNIAAGQLGESQREWLLGYLKKGGNKPRVVIVHHNPDPADDNGLVDASTLLDILDPAHSVKAVIFGHTHSWRHEERHGLHLVNVPAVGYNFKDSEPVGWTDAFFSDKEARLRLNAIGGNTTRNGEVLVLKWR
jgi:3',5'-cyclic-AMP phosphodiesterase